MFLLKKLVSQLFCPMPVVLTLLLLATCVLLFTKRSKSGKFLLLLSLVLLSLFSFSFVPNRMMLLLESTHEAYTLEQHGRVPFVVVLGGGVMYDPTLPVTSRLSHSSTPRLLEGIRIHNLNPGSALVLSGGRVFGAPAEADMMAELAMAIGVEPSRLILEKESRDTSSEARCVKAIVGSHPFALVTSAVHMPRAMGIFTKAGMNPVAAPTDFSDAGLSGFFFFDLFPSAKSLVKTEVALHEGIGILWAWLTGQM